MRVNLVRANGMRKTFRATFSKHGVRKYMGLELPTVLLTDIHSSSGALMSDHMWFNYGKRFQDLKLEPGDEIEFEARVMPYQKALGLDYRLSHCMNFRKIHNDVNQKTLESVTDDG